MKMQHIGLSIVAVISILVTGHSQAQSWNYQSYRNGQPQAVGYVTLEERGGENYLTYRVGPTNECLKYEMKSLVERTESKVVITPVPPRPTCDEFRLIIKADGSGGTVEWKTGDKWVPDSYERMLTIRK
jgi:hypothetical protein